MYFYLDQTDQCLNFSQYLLQHGKKLYPMEQNDNFKSSYLLIFNYQIIRP
jgi:hypothetical protein